MSPGILVEEILLLILGNLKVDSHTLAAAARTCWSLHGPAVCILWNRLSNLVPLIKLLPADAWETIKEHGSQMNQPPRVYIINLTRAPTAPQDWLAFEKYASLVRYLGYTVESEEPILLRYELEHISLATWQLLASCRRTSLLPFLQIVEWPSFPIRNRVATFPYLRLLLGPQLRHVTLTVAYIGEENLQFILEALRSTCPGLGSITVWIGNSQSISRTSPHRLPAQLSLHLAMFRHIKVISCLDVHFTVRDVLQLSLLPRLETLSISMSDSDTDPSALESTQSSPPVRIFASLKSLSIHRCQMQCYARLASAPVGFPMVEKLGLHTDVESQPGLVQPLFASIASKCSPNTLTDIVIRDSYTGTNWRTSRNIAISPRNLRHLFVFSNLRSLDINAPTWLTEYNDDVLIDMASAWPMLRYLYLNTSLLASIADISPISLDADQPLSRDAHYTATERLHA
ncbi:uncharacterized protein B0H18DRAFT_1113817 [Fomitopsis serialis]|uniref:uncharacterized protein n=1 Tax=Fomitopsis serialis TaxID=139415 RepID=UPI002007B8A6|nr:uncharacterized protein B0H18DRAFT_1113817 [Neoantrodia serialis]KAH9936429.1 hypothetical protein B0H18DRAFT_1113817 [Neoantrodia serialis]